VALAEVHADGHNWLAAAGRPDRSIVRGGYQRLTDFRASASDPDAGLMPGPFRTAHMGYHTHYVVDGGKARIILGVLVTPSSVMENQPMLDLLWRARFRWRLRPRQVTGDTTYGTIENIVPIEDAGIRAYVPLADFTHRTPYYGKDRFHYDAEQDVYWCPEEHALQRYAWHKTERAFIYRAEAATCNACPVKEACTTGQQGRTLRRSIFTDYLERVQGYHVTAAYEKAINKRKVWVEPLFGEAKQWHGLGRFRLRRLERVNIEALLIAAGQNIKRLLAGRRFGSDPGDENRVGQVMAHLTRSTAPMFVS
jgi:hypothetical protein